jgi:hypothetical protein
MEIVHRHTPQIVHRRRPTRAQSRIEFSGLEPGADGHRYRCSAHRAIYHRRPRRTSSEFFFGQCWVWNMVQLESHDTHSKLIQDGRSLEMESPEELLESGPQLRRLEAKTARLMVCRRHFHLPRKMQANLLAESRTFR